MKIVSGKSGSLSTMASSPYIVMSTRKIFKWIIQAPVGDKVMAKWNLMAKLYVEVKVSGHASQLLHIPDCHLHGGTQCTIQIVLASMRLIAIYVFLIIWFMIVHYTLVSWQFLLH